MSNLKYKSIMYIQLQGISRHKLHFIISNSRSNITRVYDSTYCRKLINGMFVVYELDIVVLVAHLHRFKVEG